MTYSIVARDAATGRLGLAQATSPMGIASRCPFVKVNVAALSTQAYTNQALGPLALNLLSEGRSPRSVLAQLGDDDPYFSWRQVGIVDVHGRAAAHTGADVKSEGHRGDLVGEGFVVIGNGLVSTEVVEVLARAWHDSTETVFERKLLEVLRAGRDAGGDAKGHRSSALIVYDRAPFPLTDLRVDYAPERDGRPDAVDQLIEMYEQWDPLKDFYFDRPFRVPNDDTFRDWLAAKGWAFAG